MPQAAIGRRLDVIPDQPLAEALVIGLLLLGACLLGIHTRLVFSLASIWPANAMLLCILLLRPQANHPLTWALAGTAFMFADFLSGSPWHVSALLNIANLATAASGLLVARMIGLHGISEANPADALGTVVVAVGGAAGSTILGAFIGPALFGLDPIGSIVLWFPSEFVNLAIFMPVALALGSSNPEKFRFMSRNRGLALQQLAALATLGASVMLMHIAGGPGAAAYAVPSLLWCAMTFRPFASAVIAMATCTWILIAAPLGLIPLNIDIHRAGDASSFRLGVSMVAIGIFVVSVINAAWRDANRQLQHVASHDSLTGLLNRGAFMRRLSASMDRKPAGKTSLLMIDIDFFKVINDTYGHPAGDQVLRELSRELTGMLRNGSVIGRLGGEEFAVLVEGPLDDSGMVVAERVQTMVRSMGIVTDNAERISVTVSIGLAEADAGTPTSQLLTASDDALYAAKRSGRNRIVAFGTKAAAVSGVEHLAFERTP